MVDLSMVVVAVDTEVLIISAVVATAAMAAQWAIAVATVVYVIQE